MMKPIQYIEWVLKEHIREKGKDHPLTLELLSEILSEAWVVNLTADENTRKMIENGWKP